MIKIHARASLLFVTTILLLTAVACSDPQETTDGDFPTTTPTPDMTPGPAVNPGPMVDPGPAMNPEPSVTPEPGPAEPIMPTLPTPTIDTTPAPGCGGDWAAFVAGWVIDDSNRPISAAKVQLCTRQSPSGMLLCLRPSDSVADGTYAIEVPESSRCVTEATMRVLVPNNDSATMYCHIDTANAANGALNVNNPMVLYNTQRPMALPPMGDESMPRTVTFPDGLEMTVTPGELYVAGEGYDGLAVTRVEDTSQLCFIPPGAPPAGVYGFSPEGDVEGAGIPLRVPNTTGLAAGTTVSLYVLGGLDCRVGGELVPEGEWFRFGSGTVDASGQFVVTDAGSELPCLTWFGYGQ